MNEDIKKQLMSCRVADIPHYSDKDTTIIIPKKVFGSVGEIKTGETYKIELMGYLVNPPIDFSFHVNWNGNNVPKYNVMIARCDRIMGKVMKCSCNSLVDDYTWSGWLPIDGVKILECIKEN